MQINVDNSNKGVDKIMEKYLIVGLGNPGKEYDNTRHQVGFMTIDLILKNLNLSLEKSQFNGSFVSYKESNKMIFVAKPMTYMNLSGEFISQFIRYYDIPVENVIVVYDDMDTKVGQIRIKPKGSCAGQNGMRNIIDLLHTENVRRIKIGIGRPGIDYPHVNKKDFVLSKFSKEEQPTIQEALKKAAMAAMEFPQIEFEKLMNKFNTK